MKTSAKKGIYIGSGAGLILFALFGLLPGSFIGGVLGINIAGSIYGMPLEPALMPRIIVGISMLLGVLLAGLVFVVGSSITGWLIGSVIDSLRHTKAEVVKTK